MLNDKIYTYILLLYLWLNKGSFIHSFIHSFTLAEKDSTASDMSESETSHVERGDKTTNLVNTKRPFL